PFRGIVRIVSDPCALTHALGLNGTGDTDGLSPDRGDITFTLDPCTFTPACEDIVLKNQGLEPVEVTGLTFSPPGTVFSLDPPAATPFSLAPNAERTIRVCASPALLGSENASLVITSDDPAYPTLSVALHAKRDSVGIEVSLHSIDFGQLAECDAVQPRNVIVTNTGTGPETLDISFANGGAAFSASVTGSVTIPSGKNTGLFVEFTRPGFGVFDDVLILTSQTCGTEYRIPLHAELVEQIYVVNPDPLNFPTVNVGGSITRQLSLQNTGGLAATVSAITIQPAGTFTVLSGVPAQIAAGSGATFDIRFNPQSEGVFSATACVIITAPCPDTVCVALRGEGVQGTLEVQPPLLAFGSRAQCQSLTLFDTLRNTGSGSITILSANITGPNAAAFTNLTPVTTPEQVLAGGRRIFDIRFNPALVAGDGPVTAALRINTNDPVLPSFDIPLEAERVTLRADAGGTIDFGPVEVGNPVDRTVTLRNDGSVPLCYSTASIPAEITILPAPPFCIDPGMTRDITVTLSAAATGNYRSDLTLYVDTPCTDSTHFALRGQAQEGSLTQPDTIDIGIIPWCENPSVDFDIVSTYLEDVTLESMRLQGPDASFISIVNPTASALPLIIPGGGAEQVTVRFIPDQRTRTFTATLVSTFTAFGSPIERRTVLTGRAVVPELTVGNASFPMTVVGQSGGRIVVRIENTSEIPVHVDGIVTRTFDFLARQVTPPHPVMLQPGQSIDVEVEFLPQNAGQLVDSLTVSSDAPCAFFASGRLEGEAIPQPIVDVTLSVSNIQGEADQVIDIPILVDQDLGPAEITRWSGSLSFNRTMLHPLEVVTEGTLSDAMAVAMQYDNATGTVSLTASGARVADGSGILVIVRCLVLIGNDVTTNLQLSDAFAFDDGYARIIGREDGRFDLVNYCLPGERLVNERPGFMLDQNRPNPVSQSIRPITTISYVLPEEMTVALDLYDMIGRRIRRIDEGQRNAGLHTVSLSISDLQPGTYMYVLRSTQQTAVRRMVVVR
ncbi:MAG: choice-of-anchor D domain-containing protein, partial [Bacteroidetes bacterium]|nr:choice-of-anchor D domain-containing protein [Bacteroidota bacterium]